MCDIIHLFYLIITFSLTLVVGSTRHGTVWVCRWLLYKHRRSYWPHQHQIHNEKLKFALDALFEAPQLLLVLKHANMSSARYIQFPRRNNFLATGVLINLHNKTNKAAVSGLWLEACIIDSPYS